MRVDTLHLTLEFIGRVPADRVPAIEVMAESIHQSAFTLRLDRLEYIPSKGIVWARCDHTPPALTSLVQSLKANLAGYSNNALAPGYLAHLKLLRNVRQPPHLPMMSPIDWNVNEFRLIRSELHAEGSRYSKVGCWPLGLAREGGV